MKVRPHDEHPVLHDAVHRMLALEHPSEQPPPGAGLAALAGGRRYGAVAGERQTAELAGESLPLTIRTSHDLASVTKIVGTTASLMRLVSDGSVALDDPASRYVAGFDGDKAAITVRLLLQHRAGLWEWQPIYLEASDPAEAMRAVSAHPLRYPVDEARHYSDLGFMTLGRVVETVTGLPIDAAVRQLVLDPFGLGDTSYGAPVDGSDVAASSVGDRIEKSMIDTGEPYPVERRSADFAGWRDRVLRGEVNDGNAFHAFGGAAGHAGLFSTLDDLLTLGAALASAHEHEHEWRPDVVAEFFTEGPDAGQALGFRSYREPGGRARRLVGHTGFTGTALVFAPGEGVTLAAATNRLHVAGTPASLDRILDVTLAAASDLDDSIGLDSPRKDAP